LAIVKNEYDSVGYERLWKGSEVIYASYIYPRISNLCPYELAQKSISENYLEYNLLPK